MIDAEGNLRIKTTEGFRFNGYLKIGYFSQHNEQCARINEPQYVKLSFEICGNEQVLVRE